MITRPVTHLGSYGHQTGCRRNRSPTLSLDAKFVFSQTNRQPRIQDRVCSATSPQLLEKRCLHTNDINYKHVEFKLNLNRYPLIHCKPLFIKDAKMYTNRYGRKYNFIIWKMIMEKTVSINVLSSPLLMFTFILAIIKMIYNIILYELLI